MHNYTREDIIRIVEEEDVAFIRLQFTDIFGTLKNMVVAGGNRRRRGLRYVSVSGSEYL